MANIRKIICGSNDPLKGAVAAVIGQSVHNGWVVHSIIEDVDFLKQFGMTRYEVYISKGNNIEPWKRFENQSVIVEFDAITDEEYLQKSFN